MARLAAVLILALVATAGCTAEPGPQKSPITERKPQAPEPAPTAPAQKIPMH